MKILIFTTAFLLFAANANSASFDCARASTLVEQAICSDAKLSELDESMAHAYKKAIASSYNASALKSEQRTWLTGVRNKCSDVTCLTRTYLDRQKELSALSDKNAPATVKKDVPKQVTVRGIIKTGTLDSAIEDADGNGAMFLTDSEEGNKIFAVCGSSSLCEVTGKVVGEYSQLIFVTKVKLIKEAP